MKIIILEYRKNTNDCLCMLPGGAIKTIDPFVGCALPLSDDDYHNNKGFDIVNKWYELPDNVLIESSGIILPGEGEMVEIDS